MKRFEQILCFVLFVSFPQFAQDIPNAGFENWIDETTPQEWNTNNFPSFWTTVSRSSSPYAGSYAAKLEIADASGFPFPTVLTSTFPVSQGYETISGYYQFHPTTPDVVFSIYAYYFGGGFLLGTGSVDITNEASSYTQFSFNVSLSDTPDSLWLQMEVVSNSATSIGSYALVDQLSLGGTSDVEPINFIPSDFSFRQNYPNPFNPSTTIEFSIPEETFVELKVFNILGREVSILVNDNYAAGNYEVDFNGNNLPSGVYISRMKAEDFTKSFKMILLK